VPDAGVDTIARLMDHVRETIRAEHTVASMAAEARLGTRTFQRRFKERTGLAPLGWLVRERVALAAQLLESRPQLAIDAIADMAGLGSAESLRRHFRAHGLAPPGRYRRQSSERAVL
jgi:AraC family transcriptional activator FtrA